MSWLPAFEMQTNLRCADSSATNCSNDDHQPIFLPVRAYTAKCKAEKFSTAIAALLELAPRAVRMARATVSSLGSLRVDFAVSQLGVTVTDSRDVSA